MLRHASVFSQLNAWFDPDVAKAGGLQILTRDEKVGLTDAMGAYGGMGTADGSWENPSAKTRCHGILR